MPPLPLQDLASSQRGLSSGASFGFPRAFDRNLAEGAALRELVPRRKSPLEGALTTEKDRRNIRFLDLMSRVLQ